MCVQRAHHVHELLQQVSGRLPQRDQHLIQVSVANPLLEHLLWGAGHQSALKTTHVCVCVCSVQLLVTIISAFIIMHNQLFSL